MVKLKEKDLTQDLIKYFFEYKDGFLYWRNSDYSPNIIGTRAGYIRKNKDYNRYIIKLKTGCFFGARIIFFYHYGYFPIVVDHKDRNTMNNHIENLRAATKSENSKNKKKRINCTSKHTGVCFNRNENKWISAIKVNFKSVFLGYFETEDEAAIVYNEMAKKHHGEFANLNIIDIIKLVLYHPHFPTSLLYS